MPYPSPAMRPANVDWPGLFREHVRWVETSCERALEHAATAGAHFDGILFHAGSQELYHLDDQQVPFRPSAHFGRWGCVPGPDHLLVYRPGEKPHLVRTVPEDYWYGPPEAGPVEDLLGSAYELATAPSLEAALGEVGSLRSLAYLGNAPGTALAAGIAEGGVEPPELLGPLDWERATKSDYEIECIRGAARRAGLGHAAVRAGAAAGASERVLQAAYLEASDQLDTETPYPNIIAWNEGAAVLHYEARKSEVPRERRCCLIDAGADFHGYASDITRTYAERDAHPVFAELVAGMERLQVELVAAVRPGSYVAIHERAAHGVSALLEEVGILRVAPEQALALELDRAFFPHGVGHHLGLQVHDVGGQQAGPLGGSAPPPLRSPSLRTTRELAPRQVVTIEPGLYFIPLLLRELRARAEGQHVDWPLVDTLVPCGGIRIEDDVVVTESGCENLSRPFVPGATQP